jgi:hypothetical protein
MANESGYISSALDYWTPLPRYTGMGEGTFVKYSSVNTIDNATSILFKIPKTDDYIDMQESYMQVGLKVFKKGGALLDGDSNVCLADNVLGSLFSAVTLSLNGTQITESNVYQALENYFVTRFGASKAAVSTHLEQMQGLTTEQEDKHDAETGPGRVRRKAWTATSKEAHFIGPIPCDFFRSCANYIPPLQEATLEFKLNDPEFVLIAPNGDFQYKLTYIELRLRHLEIAPSLTMNIFKRQATQPLRMNFTSMEVQSFSFSAGSHLEVVRGIFPFKKPSQIFMVLIETDRLNGNIKKDPFKFTHGSVEKVVLRLNGRPCMIDSIETDFTKENAHHAYKFVMEAFNVGFNGRDVNLTYDQFLKGCTMWAWTLSPDMDANNGVALMQTTSNLEAEINVSSTATNPGLTALFIGKFGKTVIIADNKTSVQ